MTTPVMSGMAAADGADLYFERRGDGPPLLMIAGGGGDCWVYSAVADILAGEYAVVTYDRRGNSRSPLHQGRVKTTITEQSADAIAVLRASGFESARIFGSSAGAIIALDLAAHHPRAVRAVVAHEPPLPKVLADYGEYPAHYDKEAQVMVEEGWQAALAMFMVRTGQIPPGQPEAMTFVLEPDKVVTPGPLLDQLKRLSGNWEYLMTYEMRSFLNYEPDLDGIRRSGTRIALAAGADTHDRFLHRMSAVIAARLGAEFVEFPGGHTAARMIPDAFANKLSQLFEQL
jgi:pimeloyl-ACP methyl ester carboxylesterase